MILYDKLYFDNYIPGYIYVHVCVCTVCMHCMYTCMYVLYIIYVYLRIEMIYYMLAVMTI